MAIGIDDLPAIGFGPGIMRRAASKNTWFPKAFSRFCRAYEHYLIKPRIEEEFVDSTANAINSGFRILDYSCSYGDGLLFGKGIKKSGIDRNALFITTRVSNTAQYSRNIRGEFFRFLERARIDYVDLLQFHWPVTGYYLDTWHDMESLYEEGYVKHLGVANCHPHHLTELFASYKYRPEIGQFEIHPLLTQKPLIEFYKQHGIVVEAYTPIARYDDRLVRLPLLKRLESKYDKTFVQIILRWHVQNGVIPIVRSMSKEHQKEDLDIFDFELTQEDMAAIDAININSRLRYDPDNCDFSIL